MPCEAAHCTAEVSFGLENSKDGRAATRHTGFQRPRTEKLPLYYSKLGIQSTRHAFQVIHNPVFGHNATVTSFFYFNSTRFRSQWQAQF